MSYTVLARRYRSQSFDEVVGQEAVAQTLRNAIAHNRVAHAYLFCGTRGVGKTSMARIFAKALNAVDDDGNEIPEVAQAIMAGRDTDVIEIDAASHNKVEEARELIANSIYRPLRGRRKIYIIDEVHMLTTQAFNALLKTMEEPPEHVVFILCTTETHKVPATIQSRCQRFDFRNISTSSIAEHLGEVIRGEDLTAEPDLIHMVARLGNGSMRDALSLLDRLMASGDEKLTVERLEDLLGLPDRSLVTALVEAIADGDPGASLQRTDELLKRGIAPDQLVSTLADRFRDLMVINACGPDTDLVELAGDSRVDAVTLASRFDEAGLVHMIALCDGVARHSKSSSSPRALLDALMVRLALAECFADVAALLSGAAPSHPPSSNGAPPGKARGMLDRGAEHAPIASKSPQAARQEQEEFIPQDRAPLGTDVPPHDFWEGVRIAAQSRPALVPVLARVEIKSLAQRALTLICPPNVEAAVRSRLESIKDLCDQVAGTTIAVDIEVIDSDERPAPVAASAPQQDDPIQARAEPTSVQPTIDRESVESDPLVREAMSLFGAKLIDVLPPPTDRAS